MAITERQISAKRSFRTALVELPADLAVAADLFRQPSNQRITFAD